MALTIKNLGAGPMAYAGTLENMAIPSAGKSILIKNVILVNKSSGAVAVSLSFVGAATAKLLPDNTSIPGYGRLVLNEELSLQYPVGGTQEKLKGYAASNNIEYVVNGLERDL